MSGSIDCSARDQSLECRPELTKLRTREGSCSQVLSGTCDAARRVPGATGWRHIKSRHTNPQVSLLKLQCSRSRWLSTQHRRTESSIINEAFRCSEGEDLTMLPRRTTTTTTTTTTGHGRQSNHPNSQSGIQASKQATSLIAIQIPSQASCGVPSLEF